MATFYAENRYFCQKILNAQFFIHDGYIQESRSWRRQDRVEEVWTEIQLDDDDHDLPGEVTIYLGDADREAQVAMTQQRASRLDFYTMLALAARFFYSLLPKIKQWTQKTHELQEIKVHIL